MNAATLIQAGGSEWVKGSMHRVYFNRLAEWYGLEVETYRSGNISAAWVDGEEISNSQARSLDVTFRSAKLYYDVAAGQWMQQGLSAAAAKRIISRIEAKAQPAVETTPPCCHYCGQSVRGGYVNPLGEVQCEECR